MMKTLPRIPMRTISRLLPMLLMHLLSLRSSIDMDWDKQQYEEWLEELYSEKPRFYNG
jgi:hypothetical protein